MHSADYAVARCLSVCLSVTRRYSVETAEHIIKVFSLSSSQTILVFLYQTGWQYSDAGVECKGGMKQVALLLQRGCAMLCVRQ